MTDTLWNGVVAVAGRALVAKVPGQLEPHRYAHDSALRIVRTVDHLVTAMPQGQRPKRVDLVRIAALYACIGLSRHDARSQRAPDPFELLHDAAELASDQLGKLLPASDVDLTLRILHEHRSKNPTLPEACLLSDAIALEDMGLVGLWNQTRNAHAAGRSLEHLIKFWKTQREYGYWEARLRDGFHFDISRKAAQRRLDEMAPIFDQLYKEYLGDDIT